MRTKLLIFCAAIALFGTEVWAACPANNGAVGVPSVFWGKLRPTDTGRVPDARDTTEYVGGAQTTDYRHPLFSSLDVEEGYVFTSYAFGMMIWDARGANAGNPQFLSLQDQGRKAFLENIGFQEQRWLLWDVDAPPGNSNLVALSGIGPFGLTVWDTTNKSDPKILYQDTGRTSYQVFATTISGRHYAFAASNGVGVPQQGLLMYDLSAAKERYGSTSSVGCKEDSFVSATCGVFKQRLGPADGFQYIDGFTTATGRTFIVATGGSGYVPGIKLWEVTNPNSPIERGHLFSNQTFHGAAVWEQEGRQFVAVQQVNGNTRIHEITSCLNTGCQSLPQLWTSSWSISLRPFVRWITYSQGSDGKGYLYIGTEHSCIEEAQGEWIYDLSKLTTVGPEEITPKHTEIIGGKQVGYWSYYYPTRSTGFNRVHPRVGKVNGTHFYRAAWTLFDVHLVSSGDGQPTPPPAPAPTPLPTPAPAPAPIPPSPVKIQARFAAVTNCQVAPCIPEFKAGQPIVFTDSSTGAERYDYDWDGNGVFEDINHSSPVTSHTYSSPSSFSPRLQVRRDGLSSIFIHAQIIVTSNTPEKPTTPTPIIETCKPCPECPTCPQLPDWPIECLPEAGMDSHFKVIKERLLGVRQSRRDAAVACYEALKRTYKGNG